MNLEVTNINADVNLGLGIDASFHVCINVYVWNDVTVSTWKEVHAVSVVVVVNVVSVEIAISVINVW